MELKRNMQFFYQRDQLTQDWLKLFLICPAGLLAVILKQLFRSSFGKRFMYEHAMKAPEEMELLHHELEEYMNKGYSHDYAGK